MKRIPYVHPSQNKDFPEKPLLFNDLPIGVVVTLEGGDSEYVKILQNNGQVEVYHVDAGMVPVISPNKLHCKVTSIKGKIVA